MNASLLLVEFSRGFKTLWIFSTELSFLHWNETHKVSHGAFSAEVKMMTHQNKNQ